ncbi:hypothetical protein MNBD_UNCLBAC01-1590 [hydrothermal vent metagenome]|uniref:DUF4062 domain-containing protein n=1 Tax=hydrothermal vent metagenome TaxID=652676 RepID=A0A3B1DT46_9ZZZZ
MLYKSIKRIRIFLASAGDVEKERNLLENILKKENELHYKPQGYIFDFVRWERDSLIDNQGWQESLNSLIDECEIFLMVAWRKLGKGTKEEFEYAVIRQKEKKYPDILVYRNIEAVTEDDGVNSNELDNFMKDLRNNHKQVRVFNCKINSDEKKIEINGKEKREMVFPDYVDLDYRFKRDVANWFYQSKKQGKLDDFSASKKQVKISTEKFRRVNKGF